MSKMKELYDKVAADAELLRKFADLAVELSSEKTDEVSGEKLVAFARELGYDVTLDEINSFFDGMEKAGELSDDDLDMVAGGKSAGGLIAGSAICLYIGCGIMSIVFSATGDDCGERLSNIA